MFDFYVYLEMNLLKTGYLKVKMFWYLSKSMYELFTTFGI